MRCKRWAIGLVGLMGAVGLSSCGSGKDPHVPVASLEAGRLSTEELEKLDESVRRELGLNRVESTAHVLTIFINSKDDPASEVILYNVDLLLDSSGDIVFLNTRRQGGRLSSRPASGRSSDRVRAKICSENLRANQENCDITVGQLIHAGIPVFSVSDQRREAALSLRAFTKKVRSPGEPEQNFEIPFTAQQGGYLKLTYPVDGTAKTLEIQLSRKASDWTASVQQIQVDASYDGETRTGIRSVKPF